MKTVGGIGKQLILALLFLLFLAWAAHQIFEWLLPLIPNMIGALAVLILFSSLLRLWRKT